MICSLRKSITLRLSAWALFFCVLAAPVAHADPARDEARAQKLFTEIRCVQCQGQDIADSDAQIAADMRREIRDAIRAGETDARIRQTLYDHYGDFVLFRPRFSPGNLLLWLLPPLVVITGASAFLLMRKKPSTSETYAFSDSEEKKLREIMKNPD